MSDQVRLFPSWRLFIAIICTSSISVLFIQRLNIAYSSICMLNTTLNNSSRYIPGSLYWQKSDTTNQLTAYAVGHLISNIPASMIVQAVGPTVVGATAHLLITAMSLMLPIAANMNPYFALSTRVVMGIAASLLFSAILRILSRWVIPSENGVLFGIYGLAPFLGIILAIPISVETCLLESPTSWQLAFYISGGCGLLVFIIWTLFVRSHADNHPYVSQNESDYINSHLDEPNDPAAIPWKSMLTNKNCVGFFVAHAINDLSAFTLINFINILLVDQAKGYRTIRDINYLIITYWFSEMISAPIAGLLFGYIRSRDVLSRTNARRLFVFIGTIIPAIMELIWAQLNEEDVASSTIILILLFATM
ncbi:hypothetical protein ACOME3_001854 [Neoechinorhynchus agilis]